MKRTSLIGVGLFTVVGGVLALILGGGWSALAMIGGGAFLLWAALQHRRRIEQDQRGKEQARRNLEEWAGSDPSDPAN